MRLTFPHFDARQSNCVSVTDQDTGQQIGYISSDGVGFAGFGGIYISLFGDRYRTTVNTYQQCCGVVKGVELVLSHMISAHPLVAQNPISDAA